MGLAGDMPVSLRGHVRPTQRLGEYGEPSTLFVGGDVPDME